MKIKNRDSERIEVVDSRIVLMKNYNVGGEYTRENHVNLHDKTKIFEVPVQSENISFVGALTSVKNVDDLVMVGAAHGCCVPAHIYIFETNKNMIKSEDPDAFRGFKANGVNGYDLIDILSTGVALTTFLPLKKNGLGDGSKNLSYLVASDQCQSGVSLVQKPDDYNQHIFDKFISTEKMHEFTEKYSQPKYRTSLDSDLSTNRIYLNFVKNEDDSIAKQVDLTDDLITRGVDIAGSLDLSRKFRIIHSFF